MAELSSKTIESLREDLSAKREELRVVRFGAAGSRSRNVHQSRTLKKDIARLMTEISARKLAKEAKTA
jgi:ribosomal protein L29